MGQNRVGGVELLGGIANLPAAQAACTYDSRADVASERDDSLGRLLVLARGGIRHRKNAKEGKFEFSFGA